MIAAKRKKIKGKKGECRRAQRNQTLNIEIMSERLKYH